MLLPVYDKEFKKVKEFELDDKMSKFDETKNHLIQEAVLSYLKNKRKGCASTLNRALITGSNRKPYRQKGTGLARLGTLKSPLLRGGGVIFGPTPREFNYKMSQKKKVKALNLAIAQKISTNSFFIVDEFNLEIPKTKEIIFLLKNFGLEGSVLYISENFNYNVFKSFANITKAEAKVLRELNVFNLLKYDTVLFSQNALKRFQEKRFG